jgi:hypothetical protein
MAKQMGINGRHYSDDQRKAIFAHLGHVKKNDVLRVRNEFAAPAVAAGGAAASAAVGVAVDITKDTVKMPGKIIGGGVNLGLHEAQQAEKTVGTATAPVLQTGGALLGDIYNDLEDELGGPPMPTVPELIANSYLDKNGKPIAIEGVTENVNGVPLIDPYVVYSESSAYDIDVDKMRKVVKKEYPGADVDTKVIILPPDKYMSRALKDNPGREDEAMISNGFYSPSTDKTYLEAGDKLNTTRALIHELVHDMSDDGVKEDFMINEGYADYVAFRIMTDELNIPKGVAVRTLGYPKEVKQVENLVNEYGRKNVDEAFLKYHTLGSLKEGN